MKKGAAMTTIWEVDPAERGRVCRFVEGLLDSDSIDQRAAHLKEMEAYLKTTIDSCSVVASAILEMVN